MVIFEVIGVGVRVFECLVLRGVLEWDFCFGYCGFEEFDGVYMELDVYFFFFCLMKNIMWF